MLSERLKMAMQLAEMNQTGLAKACGVKPPSISGWLNGKSKFLRGENLLKAAAALDVNPHWLATGEGPREASNHALMPAGAASAATKDVATLGQTLERLGELLARADEKTRNDVAALLLRYAQNPAEGKRLAQAIEILLGAEPN